MFGFMLGFLYLGGLDVKLYIFRWFEFRIKINVGFVGIVNN